MPVFLINDSHFVGSKRILQLLGVTRIASLSGVNQQVLKVLGCICTLTMAGMMVYFMLRSWSREGQDPASCFAGTLALRVSGSTARTDCPSFIEGPNNGEVNPLFNSQRAARSEGGRGTLASTTFRPMSTR